MVILPVATKQVGCTAESVGLPGVAGALLIVSTEDAEIHPSAFLATIE
jgi:hypothetical protein